MHRQTLSNGLRIWCQPRPNSESVAVLLPDYDAAIDAVTPADLSQVAGTYFTPQGRYVGVHQPVATVVSGVRAVGAAVGLGIGAWIARWFWRQSRTRFRSGPALPS